MKLAMFYVHFSIFVNENGKVIICPTMRTDDSPHVRTVTIPSFDGKLLVAFSTLYFLFTTNFFEFTSIRRYQFFSSYLKQIF